MKPKDLKNILGDLEEPTAEKKLKVERDEVLDEIVSRIHAGFERQLSRDWDAPKVINFEKDKIPPQAISRFADSIFAYKDEKEFLNTAYEFIIKLIQNSYNAGHNDFSLRLPWQNYYCGNRIVGPAGTPEKKLRIEIKNGVGEFAFFGAENISVKITGSAAYNLGSRSCDSDFTVLGNVKDHCGYEAAKVSYEICGNADEFMLSWSKDCKALVHKNAGKFCGAFAKNPNITVLGRVGHGFTMQATKTALQAIMEKNET